MRMKQQHRELITTTMLEFVEEHREAYDSKAKCTTPMGMMWLLYNKSIPLSVRDEILEYCDDDHIRTILKRVHKLIK